MVLEDEGHHDPFGDMMSKILGQDVSKKVPILAKRKTDIMKSLEEDREDKKRQKVSLQEKKSLLEKQLVKPDMITANYEKQLKKIATRGVIALFNAIAQAHRSEAESSEVSKKSSQKDAKKSTDIVQELSRDNFVKLLKSQQETSSGSKAVSSNWNAVKEINVANSNKNKKKGWDESDDESDNNSNEVNLSDIQDECDDDNENTHNKMAPVSSKKKNSFISKKKK